MGGSQDSDQETPERFIVIDKHTTLIDSEQPKEGCFDELLIFFLFNENLNDALDKYLKNQGAIGVSQEDSDAVRKSIDDAIEEWERFFQSCEPKNNESNESVVTVPLDNGLNLVLEARNFDAWCNDIIGTISFQYGWIQTDLSEGDYPESYRWLKSFSDNTPANLGLLREMTENNDGLG